MTEPEWVQRERAELEKGNAPKHREGEKLTRCQVCFNLGPYCTCNVGQTPPEAITVGITPPEFNTGQAEVEFGAREDEAVELPQVRHYAVPSPPAGGWPVFPISFRDPRGELLIALGDCTEHEGCWLVRDYDPITSEDVVATYWKRRSERPGVIEEIEVLQVLTEANDIIDQAAREGGQ